MAVIPAGWAASGKPFLTLHDEEQDHALKEIAAACATARHPDQVDEILKNVTRQV